MAPWEREHFLASMEQALSQLQPSAAQGGAQAPRAAAPARAPGPAAPAAGKPAGAPYGASRSRMARAAGIPPPQAQRSAAQPHVAPASGAMPPPWAQEPPPSTQQHAAPPPPSQQPGNGRPAARSGVWQHPSAAEPSAQGAVNGSGLGAASPAAAPPPAAAAAAPRRRVPPPPAGQVVGAAAPATGPAAAAAAAWSAPSDAAHAADQQHLLRQLVRAEWGLTYEQQRQQPFEPPDVAGLRRPIPVIFDLETTGAHCWVAPARGGWLFWWRLSAPLGCTWESSVQLRHGGTGVSAPGPSACARWQAWPTVSRAALPPLPRAPAPVFLQAWVPVRLSPRLLPCPSAPAAAPAPTAGAAWCGCRTASECHRML